ncbi:tRNA (adenosine(37)-N6)-threonylcarbamoyltransferase complex dimerization subunit type 1 TsaB [Suttonella ornithocola]|uniref:tRNA threonylcarbamoyladenosine biosynthesis protein TsaB n=1 Tax=Suttonella ornithocola TaxID=279832 RepID=A0A380MVG5_9GAMM|nr:tRNA (adenosine(37)-N6)-threonylcarbamoyltransferase complex dimerization subunit type 1 TsaB [Suttonella ornithocola]SUO95397.1 UGMP family protein [Suttonella ornithocola]
MNNPDFSCPLLAIDTSTPACSVALRADERIFSRFHQGHGKHTDVILPMIDELFQASGYTLQSLAGIILSAGPGAFTGLRVGASVAAGLAAAFNTPIGCLSSLALLAAGSEKEGAVLALLDARMQQCYAGLYQSVNSGFQCLQKDRLVMPQQLSDWQVSNVVGPGAIYFPQWAHLESVQSIPDAKNAFKALNLVRWQSASQPIEIDYLRNDVTS